VFNTAINTWENLSLMFPATVLLAELSNPVGFAVYGSAPFEQLGRSVTILGDINADGLADFAIGAPYANGPSGAKSGKVYVLFGRREKWPNPLNLSNLTANDGFVLTGLAAGSGLGWALSRAGDINGDGVDDFVAGAPFADVPQVVESSDQKQPTAKKKTDKILRGAGQSYVIFGQRGRLRLTNLRLDALNGQNGFVINGQAAGAQLGYAVSDAGDLNGDRLGDVILGAPLAPLGNDPQGERRGQAQIIFGWRGAYKGTMDWKTLQPRRSLTLSGASSGEQAGFALANAGDINGDGVTDVVIGAPFANVRGVNSGRSYVLYGSRVGFPSLLDLAQLTSRNGLTLNGFVPQGRSGYTVDTATDVNGDGIDDLLIGAPFAYPSGLYSGQSYVVLGRRGGFASALDLNTLNGRNGWMLNGQMGRTGWAVAGLGDINGDRKGDVLIGAPYDPGQDRLGTGRGYVVFGRVANTTEATISLPLLNGKTGIKLNGRLAEEAVGYAVAGRGDLNGDRWQDFIITAPLATANGHVNAGQVYVIFGKPPEPPKVARPAPPPKPKPPAANKKKVILPQGGGQLNTTPTPPPAKTKP
jgi:glycosylphosphatidylinositol phospholipase D